MLDLFGAVSNSPKQIAVSVFHDERFTPSNWLYHAFLLIPNSRLEEVRRCLACLRMQAGCSPEKRIHYYQLTARSTTSTRTRLATLWAKAYKLELANQTWFSILGIDLNKIDHRFFGDGTSSRAQEDYRIYNRFFEMGLFGALRYFFGDYAVMVTAIYCEKRDHVPEDPFLWHPAYAINRREANICIISPQVEEISPDPIIESDHPELTDILQYVDVIVGGHSQNLDYSSKGKTGCNEVADALFPVTEHLVGNAEAKKNPYHGQYRLSFFPRRRTSPGELEQTIATQFYTHRQIKRIEKIQPRLFEI